LDVSPEILAVGGGSAGVGGFIIWLIRRMITKYEDAQVKHAADIVTLNLKLAEKAGKDELVWREINTDKHKIAELQSSNKKLWEVISRLAPKRPSDKLTNEAISKLFGGLGDD